MAKRQIVIPYKELEHRYIDSLQSSNDIAREFGCSRSTVTSLLQEYSIPIRTSKEAHNVVPYVSRLKAWTKNNKSFLGKTHTQEWKDAMSLRLKGVPKSPEHIEKVRAANTGKSLSIEHVEKLRMINLLRYQDPAERERTRIATKQAFIDNPSIKVRQAEATKLRMSDPVIRKACTGKLIEYAKSETHRVAQSEVARKLWQNPEFRAKRIATQKKIWRANDFEVMKKMMLANCISPNKPETSVLNILNELYPNEWKFTGDGQVIIDGLNPDFVNTNGKKLIIEVFGNYWHRQNVKPYRVNEGRVDVYAQYGYKTLIIWEHETKNPEVLRRKILEFVS